MCPCACVHVCLCVCFPVCVFHIGFASFVLKSLQLTFDVLMLKNSLKAVIEKLYSPKFQTTMLVQIKDTLKQHFIKYPVGRRQAVHFFTRKQHKRTGTHVVSFLNYSNMLSIAKHLHLLLSSNKHKMYGLFLFSKDTGPEITLHF